MALHIYCTLMLQFHYSLTISSNALNKSMLNMQQLSRAGKILSHEIINFVRSSMNHN